MTDDTESVEDRIDQLEDQFDDLNIGKIETRLESIENEQEALRDDIGVLVESLREEHEKTPHIESVEALYHRLTTLENNISELRAALENIVEDSEE